MSNPTPETIKQIVLSGWIRPCGGWVDVNTCRDQLVSFGVEVGPWDMFAREFQECKVSLSALKKLDPLWGKYIWGLS